MFKSYTDAGIQGLKVVNPYSAKPISNRKEKFFRQFYNYFSFYAREKKFN